MRKSNDVYKMPNGELIEINQMTQPPENAKLWQGYDYEKQEWVFNDKKDIRTLEELKANLINK